MQFSALQGTPWKSYLKNLTTNELKFLYIKRYVEKKKLVGHNKAAK